MALDRRRRVRNLATLGALLAMVVLFFLISAARFTK
jgi:hypothetical protein